MPMVRPTIELTHSLTAALDQLRVVASSTSNDPGPRSRQHQQIGQRLLPLLNTNRKPYDRNSVVLFLFGTPPLRYLRNELSYDVRVWITVRYC